MDAVVARHIQGRGTAEADWQAWAGLEKLQRLDIDALVPPGARTYVVAPHPDDELLGAGGLISLLHKRGRDVQVVLATDGSASHPGSSVWPAQRLAVSRARETRQALKILLNQEIEPWELHLQDGTLEQRQEELARMLSARVAEGDVIVTTWRQDGHPDHEAAARACEACAKACRVRLLEMPIWGWHWMQPGEPAMPWERARRLDLPADVAAAKRRAVQAYTSQIEPDDSTGREAILPSWALERCLRSFEVFIG